MRIALLSTAVIALATAAQLRAEGCIGMAASSAQIPGGFASEFAATKILDIDIWVLFTPGSAKRLADDHTVDVRFKTPSGYHYQSIAIPFSADAGKKGKERKLDGYPHPIPTQGLQEVTWKNGKQLGTSVRLPVAGTYVMTNSLYGTWTAEAFVDGEPLPCAQPLTFSIAP
jgi:hypothetical protein